MRRRAIATDLTLAVALLGASIVTGLAQGQGQGGQPLPMPPGGFKPPPPAPVKPYSTVAAPPPQAYADPGFQAFHQQLAAIAAHKDRAALAKLVVAHGFFWVQDKDIADKNKAGIDNFAKAINLDAKDGSGWETLSGFAGDPTGAELPEQKGVVCGPADPALDPKAFQALMQATQTDPSEWGYPVKDGVEMRAAAQPNAPVVEKFGNIMIRVLGDNGPGEGANPPPFLHVAAPDGKSGFVASDAMAPLGGDQMCFRKDAGGWKITGYFGGAGQ